MAFSDRTLNGAYRKMLRAACIHIGRLAYHGGADDMFTRDRYDYFGERKGGLHFRQPGLRNIIWFPKVPQLLKLHAELGEKVPVGTAREHFAYYQTVQNDTHREIRGAEVNYQTNRESTVTDEHESMLGWNWSIAIEAQAGGGEASGGSYVKVTGTTGMEGSETDRHGTGGLQGDQAGLVLRVDVPACSSIEIDQLVRIQDVEQQEFRKIICDVPFKVVGYKHLENHGRHPHWLDGNKDWRDWHGKSRIIFESDGNEDLYEILTGGHADYPKQRRNLIDEVDAVRQAWEYLSNPDNRTIEYTVTREIEDAFFGHCRVSEIS